jgi:hypothetical protein
MFIYPSEPQVSSHETFLYSETYQHTESITSNTHSPAYHITKTNDTSNRHSLPSNANPSMSCDPTTQAVDAMQQDYTRLTRDALHYHNGKSKSSHKDITAQYVHSQRRTYGSIPASTGHTTHSHPYPTSIHEADLEQPSVQVQAQAQVNPLHSTQILCQGPAPMAYALIGIGAQFPL